MAIGSKVSAECIKGIKRIREMWRIYMDNKGDRLSLIVQGTNLRGRQVPLHSQNPSRLQPDTIRIEVKNIPLSADGGQIHQVLTLEGCDIQGLFRERLRVKGKVTNCETGDRLVICKFLEKSIPRNLQIGKYMGKIFHSGQLEKFKNRNPDDSVKTCHKYLKPGHLMFECPNDWVCRKCEQSGHNIMDCPHDCHDNEAGDPVHNGDKCIEIQPLVEDT